MSQKKILNNRVKKIKKKCGQKRKVFTLEWAYFKKKYLIGTNFGGKKTWWILRFS